MRTNRLWISVALFASLSVFATATPPIASRPAHEVAASRPASGDADEAIRRVQAYLSPIPSDIRFDGDVVYREVGESKLRLDVYRPAKGSKRGLARSGTRPAVIYVHGGAWKMGSKAMGRSLLIDLARRGYVAFSIDYRLLPDGRFPRCIEDCKAGVRWVKAHASSYGVDPQRIGLIGASAGAHLAALMAVSGEHDFVTKENDDQRGNVAAVVALFGPFDLRGFGEYAGGLVHALIGGAEKDMPEAYRRISPYTYVEAAAEARRSVGTNGHTTTNAAFPPFLLIHGDADLLVDISQSRKMCKALCDAGSDARLIEVHGGVHGLMVGHMEPSPEEFRQTMFEFLDQYLRRK